MTFADYGTTFSKFRNIESSKLKHGVEFSLTNNKAKASYGGPILLCYTYHNQMVTDDHYYQSS